MFLLTEACMSLTEEDGGVFWKNYSHFSAIQCFINQSCKCHNSETIDSVPDIIHTGLETQHVVSAAVGACDKKMLSMADVIGFVWNNIFGI
jgi:hypothetical protein